MKRIQRQVLMYVIISCKYEKDPIKNNQKSGNTVFQTITLFVAMKTSGQLLPNFKLIKVLMPVLIACKYEKDQMKNSEEYVMTSFSPNISGIFFRRSRAANSVVHGQILLNFELIQALMYIMVTCKYEMNLIKNVQENVMTPFFPLKPYLLPWKPVVASGQVSNSFKLLCMSSLPGNMKRIQSKIAEKM